MAPSKQKLKSGRPPTARPTNPTTLSHKATSSTIRAFHRLHKALSAAEKTHDHDLASSLRRQIDALGGLQRYQAASIQGQALDRGGDSSVVLVDWLRDGGVATGKGETGLRMLEVGALSMGNTCGTSGLFEGIVRIDLHSQAEGIREQDFMERPLPRGEGERFDVLSLSLVLNFVPTPEGRGEMLRRTCAFLRSPTPPSGRGASTDDDLFPSLFLVLPLPCVTNSRFLSDERLCCIMGSLGYALRQRKESRKLVYYLWVLRDARAPCGRFGKVEVNPGPGRNNFAVVLEEEEANKTPR